jgi:hypothetical protein
MLLMERNHLVAAAGSRHANLASAMAPTRIIDAGPLKGRRPRVLVDNLEAVEAWCAQQEPCFFAASIIPRASCKHGAAINGPRTTRAS